MSDSWGSAPPPPPRSQPPGPHAPGGYRAQPASEPTRRSGAFRDTLIVAGLAVAGVLGMVVWFGGDVSTGASTQDVLDVTLPPGLTLPPGFTLPDGDEFATAAPATATVGVGGPDEAQVIAGEALIATFPVPVGGAEQPAENGRTRSWFVAGNNWQAARDDYLAALAARGITGVLEQSVDQQSLVAENYVMTDAATSLTVSLQVADLAGQIVVRVSV